MLYTIDPANYSRFDQRKTVFGRIQFDEQAPFYKHSTYLNIPEILSRDAEGYSRLDYARALASWTVYNYFHGAFAHDKLKNPNSVMEEPELEKYPYEDPLEMSLQIKTTAAKYGADLVGITRLDERWVYSHNYEGISIDIPKEFQYAIVIAVAMDRDLIATSPSFKACTATGIGYSRMAFIISCLAEFIRNLGYKAIPIGNDTALSIPLAIDAGLGELGRHGLLISHEYGSCIRLCKIFTDLHLQPDEPKVRGIAERCKSCWICAEACRSEAISKDREPGFSVLCPSNNRGIKRWPVNHDRCYGFWIENGGECSTCIAVCPYTSQPLQKEEDNGKTIG